LPLATPSGAAEDGGKAPASWIERLKQIPATMAQFVVAFSLALRRLLPGGNSARNKLTPGLRKSGGGVFLARFTETQKRVMFGVALASILWLDVANVRGSRSAARLPPPQEMAYSEFIKQVDQEPHALLRVVMSNGRWDFLTVLPAEHPAPGRPIPAEVAAKLPPKLAAAAARSEGGLKEARFFTRPYPATGVDPSVLKLLRENEVTFGTRGTPPAARLLSVAFPIAYLGFLWYMFKGASGQGAAGTAGAQLKPGALPAGTGFSQVAGIGAAKRDVEEIVGMLREPQRYAAIGARIPAGVLLVGPPGTGKTLLARAMAAEAGLPFFYCSGTDFVEMFVGRGAARVRSLFAEAKKNAPAIVFVDELDAVGKSRSNSNNGLDLMKRSSEEEQTLLQLLACMDGLDTSNDGVICMAATNRFPLLDDALVRPGRFDRIVKVDLPDERGRAEILGVHCRRLSLSGDPAATVELAASLTPGLSGAELAAIANEAAIRSVRRGSSDGVSSNDFLDSIASFNDSRSDRNKGGGGIFGIRN